MSSPSPYEKKGHLGENVQNTDQQLVYLIIWGIQTFFFNEMLSDKKKKKGDCPY